MPEFHETRMGQQFFNAQLPRLIGALENLACAAEAMTEATEQLKRIADQLENIEPVSAELEEAPASVDVAALNALIGRAGQPPKPVPKVEHRADVGDVKAALMGMDVRPLICPDCDGELEPTDQSPDIFMCPSCARFVNWLDALQASDRYHAKLREDEEDGC